MLDDLRYALRGLRRNPGFAVVAVVTLALGMGVNTAVFSILEGLVLRPLPIEDPGRVVLVEGHRFVQVSIPDYRDVQRENTTFSALAAYRPTTMAMDRGTGAQQVFGYLVSGNYFETLGLRPALGRFFTDAEDVGRNSAPLAVLSHASWTTRFSGDPRVVGSTVRINNLPYTVIGVMPPEFHGTEVFLQPQIWVPLSMQAQVEGFAWLDSRNSANSLVVGRLKTGVNETQALADLGRIARRLAAAYPQTHDGFQFKLSVPGLFGSSGRTPASAFLTGVLVLSGLVLLGACVNLASLLTSRIVDRAHEVTLRLALGASRMAVARHVVAETLLLAVLGGSLGLALAVAGLQALTAWRLPLTIPVQFAVMPDARVFLFTGAVTILVAAIAALAPARRAWRTDLSRPAFARSGPLARGWSARDVLLATQVALCCVVVMCSLVAVRGLTRALSTPLGLEPAGLTAVGFDLGVAGYDGRTGTAFKERLLREIAALPGIAAAAMTNALPMTPEQNNESVYPDDGSATRAANETMAAVYQVSTGYFAVAGTRLLAGRDVMATDRIASPRVAVVNSAFARRVMATSNPVGKRFRFGPAGNSLIQVVGLVETGKYYALTEDPRPVVFLPIYQSYNTSNVVVARASPGAGDAAAMIGSAVQRLDGRLPLSRQSRVSEAMGLAFLPSQVAVTALGVFGVLAVVLVLVGVYGLAAYSVSARLRELGIRLAVGASPWQALRSALGRTSLILGWGSIVGIGLGTIVQGALDVVVYQASARDPLLLVAVAATMSGVGLVAAWVPARRALCIDPSRTLRAD
jgi:predicted permease